MILKLQIYSLIYSLIFGVVFYFLLDVFNKYNNKNKLILKIFFSFIFVLGISSLYFWGLIYINNGYLHIYFLFAILVGYLFAYICLHKKENSKM